MSWVATEAVRKQSPVIELGDSLRLFAYSGERDRRFRSIVTGRAA
jgi:hypothetical protein